MESATAGVFAAVAAAAVIVVAPDHDDEDQNNDPPPAVTKRAETGITRHRRNLLENFELRHAPLNP
jgi:hypothetical protein